MPFSSYAEPDIPIAWCPEDTRTYRTATLATLVLILLPLELNKQADRELYYFTFGEFCLKTKNNKTTTKCGTLKMKKKKFWQRQLTTSSTYNSAFHKPRETLSGQRLNVWMNVRQA